MRDVPVPQRSRVTPTRFDRSDHDLRAPVSLEEDANTETRIGPAGRASRCVDIDWVILGRCSPSRLARTRSRNPKSLSTWLGTVDKLNNLNAFRCFQDAQPVITTGVRS